jgi:phosphoglucomutase
MPDPNDARQLVHFGTSGHRGTSLDGTLTETHILAITQAICEYRRGRGSTARSTMGKDTHALSALAQRTALEVLAANGVETIIQPDDGVTPTPAVSRAILVYNRGRTDTWPTASSSHRPTTRRRTAASSTTRRTAARPIPTSRAGSRTAPTSSSGATMRVKRVPLAVAVRAATTHAVDFVLPYVRDLGSVIDMDAIRTAGLQLGVDPSEARRSGTGKPLRLSLASTSRS